MLNYFVATVVLLWVDCYRLVKLQQNINFYATAAENPLLGELPIMNILFVNPASEFPFNIIYLMLPSNMAGITYQVCVIHDATCFS